METTEITLDVNPHENRDRLIKLLVGTAVGFIASRVAENVVTDVLEKIENRNND